LIAKRARFREIALHNVMRFTTDLIASLPSVRWRAIRARADAR